MIYTDIASYGDSILFTLQILPLTCIYTDALYELLSQMVSEELGGSDSDPVSSRLSSVACACLLSLVVGLGDTSKILSAISTMLIGSSQLSTTIQVCMLLICLSMCVFLHQARLVS